MNNPAASCEASELGVKICLKGVIPECFYPGTVPNPPGFPLKACGNDGLRIGDYLTQQAAGNQPTGTEKGHRQNNC
jgi:hypothetical protein